MIKAWMTYETSLLGSQHACMATYAMHILVVYIFNNYSRDHQTNELVIHTEMDFFRKFFEIFGKFNWEAYMVTIYGPIGISTSYERLRD